MATTISPAMSSESSSSSSVIIPAAATAMLTTPNDGDMISTCEEDDTDAAMQILTTDCAPSHHTDESKNDEMKRRRRLSASTQGALDALAELAASSTAVTTQRSSAPDEEEPSASQQQQRRRQLMTQSAQEVTPHQTSSDDDDSEAMPPPPPRNPTNLLHPMSAAAAATTTNTYGFTFLHDSYAGGSSYTRSSGRNYNTTSAGAGIGGRMRSVSNPEGMEKWDSYSRRNDRLHFVLPSSILEEELASTRRVLGEAVDGDHDDRMDGGEEYNEESIGYALQTQPKQAGFQQLLSATSAIAPGEGIRRSKRAIAKLGTSPDSVSSDLSGKDIHPTPAKSSTKATNSTSKTSKSSRKKSCANKPTSRPRSSSTSSDIVSAQSSGDDEELDESSLEPEELLRRARTRLLEDLSEGGGSGGGNGNGNGGLNGEKGSVLILPHSLSKYKEVYNKNGRIGIYTPAERAAIIQKFNAKRARRVWNKKIRYNCRKNLADRRMRVKGRFVKRSVEATNGGSDSGGGDSSPPPTMTVETEEELSSEKAVEKKKEGKAKSKRSSSSRSNSPPTSGSPLTTVDEEEHEEPRDEEMPDVEDVEAGFVPSEDMPYRRTRRYTIT